MVNKLTKLEELIEELLSSQSVIRYKNLEKIIESKQSIKDKYLNLLELQKALVKSENNILDITNIAQSNYDEAINEIMDNPLISEYLSALEDVNEDLGMLQSIIEGEINNELK